MDPGYRYGPAMSEEDQAQPAPPEPTVPPTTDSRALSRHAAVLRVQRALDEQAASARMLALPEPARSAQAAAAQLDVEVGQIASSLLFRAYGLDGQDHPLLVLTSGAHRVDPVKLGEVLDLDHLELMDAESVRRITGFAIGGVAPVGSLTPVATVVDVALSRYAQVWAAGGHPRIVFATSYDELLRITAGQAAEVA